MPDNLFSLSDTLKDVAILKKAKSERVAADASTKKTNLISGLQAQAASGDQAAQDQLVLLDPEHAAAYGTMDEVKRKRAVEMNEHNGRLSAYVLGDATDPKNTDEQRLARYTYVIQNVDPKTAEVMKAQKDPLAFARYQLALATETKQALENPKVLNYGGKDMLVKGPNVISTTTSGDVIKMNNDNTQNDLDRKNSRGNALIAHPESVGGPMGLKSADESLMYREVAGLYGGVFDAEGNLIKLDPGARPKIMAITSAAAKLFSSGKLSRSEAVLQANKEYSATPTTLPAAAQPKTLGMKW